MDNMNGKSEERSNDPARESQTVSVKTHKTPASTDDLDAAKANLDLVIGWIEHADSKATFYLTIALAMLGASLTEIPTLVRVCEHFLPGNLAWTSLLVLLHLIFYGAALYSAFKAIEVVKPRIVPESKTHSWYFFQSIATFDDVQKWRDFTNGLDDDDKLQHLVDQIWNVSRVAVNKYRIAGIADCSLRVATCAGIVAILSTLVIAELMGP